MPYVERDNEHFVKGTYGTPQPGYAEEWLDEGHPDLSLKRPEEIAREQQAAADSAQRDDARQSPVIQYLVSHGNDEIRQYVDTAANLAALKAIVGHLAVAVAVLARRELR